MHIVKGNWIIVSVPSLILVLYVLCSRSIALYGRAGETFFPLLFLDLLAHAGIGLFLFWVCRRTLRPGESKHHELLLGMGLAVIVIAVTFLPGVNFGVCSNILFSCPAQASLILTVYGAAYLVGRKR